MLLFSLLSLVSFATPDRIQSFYHDLGKVQKVYLSPGLVSVIEFPKPIVEVRVGNAKSVKAIISQASPKELTLYFSNSQSVASNIIVRADRSVYVLDIVPSHSTHQDYLKVSGSFGGASVQSNAQLIQAESLKPIFKERPSGLVVERTSL